MFGGSREAGRIADPITGAAPVGAGAAPPFSAAGGTSARVRALRRAAAVDMLDQVGLSILPGQLWLFVDAQADPAEGVAAFLGALGLDADRIRRRDPVERERANEVLQLLLGIGDAFDHLAPDARAGIQARLFSGEYDQVRAAAEAVDVLGRIARLKRRWPDQRLALLTAFLRDVRDSLADPLALDRDDLAAAERQADALTALAIAFDEAIDRYRALRAGLDDIWPDDWSRGPEAEALDRAAAEFETLAQALLDDEALGRADVEEIVARLGAINAELDALLARAEGRTAGGKGGAGRRDAGTRGPGPLEAALAFFGFAPGSSPDRGQIRARFRELARRYHSDLAGGDDEMMKALNLHRDTLKSQFPA